MPFLSHTKVQAKLVAVTMTTCVVALVLAGLGIVGFELVTAREQLVSRLASVADIVGSASTAALQFHDADAAGESLAALRSDPSVHAARIDLPDGTAFAAYEPNRGLIPARLPGDGVETVGGVVIVSRPVSLNGRPLGVIRVQGSLDLAYAQMRRYLAILIGVLAASCLIAYLLSSALTRAISGPILNLAALAGRVTVTRNYSFRARVESKDEVGRLVEQFNDMLEQIEQRDSALSEAQAQLEARVAERTRTLELEILDHRRTENELLLAKAAAEEANVAKSAFLANMSHELRTPLNAIIGYSELLKEDADDRGVKETADDLSRIIAAGRHLLSLVTDVLDLSKIEAGKMELQVEAFDAADLVRSVVDTSQTLAEARGNSLTASAIEDLGQVRTDETKMRQVLLNLVGNACKFTSEGRVHVACRRERDDAGDAIVIAVSDTGIGMSGAQLDRLFLEFSQADSSSARRFGGTGLGLAISQRLCHLMGGSIAVSSEPGVGSTFTMRLPADVAASGPAPARPPASPDIDETEPVEGTRPPASTPGDGAPVLVVDDDPAARELAARSLGKAGFRVVLAADGDEGLRQARAVRPAAVILDLMLPDASGLAVLERMKADRFLSDVPVVVVSIVDDRGSSLALGAVAHVLKPFAGDRLVHIVQSAVSRAARAETASTAGASAPGRSAERAE